MLDVQRWYWCPLGYQGLRRNGYWSRYPSRSSRLASIQIPRCLRWCQVRHSMFRFDGLFNFYSVRRGFLVFARNCGNCHGMIYKKYDALLDKAYKQLELAVSIEILVNRLLKICIGSRLQLLHPPCPSSLQAILLPRMGWKRQIHPRQNLSSLFLSRWYWISSFGIFEADLFSLEGKNANNGVWPVDLSKIRFRPGGINYIFNILTGYYYKPPYGIDIPKGKYFNPYYDHMIIGMPRVIWNLLKKKSQYNH